MKKVNPSKKSLSESNLVDANKSAGLSIKDKIKAIASTKVPFKLSATTLLLVGSLGFSQVSHAGLFGWVPFVGPTVDNWVNSATGFVTDGITTMANTINTVTSQVGIDATAVSNVLNGLINNAANPPHPGIMAIEEYSKMSVLPHIINTFTSIPDHVNAVRALALAIQNKDTDSARAAVFYVIKNMENGSLQSTVNHLKNHGAKSLLISVSVSDSNINQSFGVAVDVDAVDDIINDTLSSAPEAVLSFFIGQGFSIGGGAGVSIAMGYSKSAPLDVGGKSFDLSAPVQGMDIALGFTPWDLSNPITAVTTNLRSKHSSTMIAPASSTPTVGSSASQVFLKVCNNLNVQMPNGTCNTGVPMVDVLNLAADARTSAGGTVFAWSSAGEIAHMYCTSISEGSEPLHHTWGDNYFCASEDIGLRWYEKHAPLASMKCAQINEPSDPDYWYDNYLCLPHNSPYSFSFHGAGNPGHNNVRWAEPADPHTWNDNYLVINHQDDGVQNMLHEGFDAEFYLNRYADLKAAFGTNYQAAYDHWNNSGKYELRQATREFDVQFYINTYADLKAAFGYNYQSAYNHWKAFGINEGRRASAEFDINFYRNYHPDLKAAFGNSNMAAYNHFRAYGPAMNTGQSNADGRRLFRP